MVMLSRRISHRSALRFKACIVVVLVVALMVTMMRPRRGDATHRAPAALDCVGAHAAMASQLRHGNVVLLSAMPATANCSWMDDTQDDVVATLPRSVTASTLTAMPTIADVLGRTSGWVRMSLALYKQHLHQDVFEWFTMGLSATAIRGAGGASSRWRPSHAAVSGDRPVVLDPEAAQVRALNHVMYWSVLRRAAPRLVYAHSMLDDLHCDALIAMGNKTLRRSTVVVDPPSKPQAEVRGAAAINVVDIVRTSSGTFLTTFSDRTSAANVALRVAAAYLLGVPESFLEPTQILRYQRGEYYVPHLDYFGRGDVDELRRGGQRVATVLVWLNDVPCGGETTFPAAGVRLNPIKGSAVVFYNVKEGDGLRPDPSSIHAGEPPLGDEGQMKWVAILWAHPRAYHAA